MAVLSASIEKLSDGRNYPMRQFRMEPYLMSKGLWRLIRGIEVEPILPKASTQADLAREQEWIKRDIRVLFIISQIVSNTMLGHIRGLNPSREAWESLICNYQQSKANTTYCMLNGLREDERWKSFITSIMTRENLPSFEDLQMLMMTEEINIEGGNSYHSQRGSQGKTLYTSSNRSRCRGNWRGRGRFNNNARGRGSFNATRGGRTTQQNQ
ncbi:hypothetical protein KP509_24G015700 [Ceratopteris richardii]|uniref:Uncharacterized protein n=1 Tax=Ceratopteris richardii TaxID=49495 RepID=A0A8T2RSP1_CERRI|nr:hypothetical protein KP509_24G015700 [Ceratopteris richardii]